MLICPSFFDGRFDGIGRVSGAFYDAIAKSTGREPFVLSANDPAGAVAPEAGRAYARSYQRMLLEATFSWRLLRRASEHYESMPLVCTHLGLSPVARLLAARSHRNYVVFLHGVECWKRLPLRSRWGISGTRVLFCNSEYTLKEFHHYNPWACKIPARIIPLGVSAETGEAIDPPRWTSGMERPFRILAVGRIDRGECYRNAAGDLEFHKGFKTVARAVGILRNRGMQVELSIAGDGNARAELEEWLHKFEHRGSVALLGRVSDERLARAYAESDAFVMASEREGFGLVFAEAMAHGMPCICADAGAAPEVVRNEEVGLVGLPRDANDFASKIGRLMAEPGLYERLSQASREKYESVYSRERFLGRIEEALLQIR